MLEQLVHNGIIIAPRPAYLGLTLQIRDQGVALNHKQEEMALAWARKVGTPYVDDPVFAQNFAVDFSLALGVSPPLSVDEIDFGPAVAVIQAEREAKAALTREEKKLAAAERKLKREQLKEHYGHALVNGERVELGNYMTEPSGIFMGRGQHPLRGRWKEGASAQDVTLNLSPDAPRPEGDWAEIVWQDESLWVARWKDKLSGKLKYVWLSDTAPVRQEREAEKFDRSIELGKNLDAVRARFEQDLGSDDAKVRMVATACYLIDVLCLRVGDEKDPEEADTVGATTLRPEHVKLRPDGMVEFKFLGKDSVEWHKKIELSPVVYQNLAYLAENARPSMRRNGLTENLPQLFPDITSRHVNEYLSSIIPSLSAKVFRTHHATRAVQESLAASEVTADDPVFIKREAAVMANMEAAILCNHTKKAPANWAARKERMRERLDSAQARVDKYQAQVREYREKLDQVRQEAREKTQAASDKQRPKVRERYRKRTATAKRRIETARGRLERARLARERVKSSNRLVRRGRTWNLGTSLKSYIDPRVYHRWGQQVDYDVIEKYYPKALRRKFAWAKDLADEDKGPDQRSSAWEQNQPVEQRAVVEGMEQ